jgi:hypothetical protein
MAVMGSRRDLGGTVIRLPQSVRQVIVTPTDGLVNVACMSHSPAGRTHQISFTHRTVGTLFIR